MVVFWFARISRLLKQFSRVSSRDVIESLDLQRVCVFFVQALHAFLPRIMKKMQFNVTSRTLIVNYLCMFLLNSDIWNFKTSVEDFRSSLHFRDQLFLHLFRIIFSMSSVGRVFSWVVACLNVLNAVWVKIFVKRQMPLNHRYLGVHSFLVVRGRV